MCFHAEYGQAFESRCLVIEFCAQALTRIVWIFFRFASSATPAHFKKQTNNVAGFL